MSTINTSLIAGYADMTAEEKVAALEAFDHPEPDYAGYVRKDSFDEVVNELANLKKSYNSLLSENGRIKKQESEKIAALETHVKELSDDKLRNEHKAKCLALGYDEALATSTADAMVKGDMETVYKNQKAFFSDRERKRQAAAMLNTPVPPPSVSSEYTDYEKKAMGALERGDYAAAAAYMDRLHK